ncbi:receptor-type tyrosine-protein phosphatase T-like [Cloeon dipterum]|uniref:receptor-type tyrosine-protein phosphatase T-like n=1 Tax=Cloeon dipterum TaxID=197152 RepID=UPI00321FCF9D
MFSVSLNVSEAGKEELCTPDSLIVTYMDDKNIMDEALEKIDFEKSVDNCKCGEHKISLIFKDFTLYQNYTCMNCPRNDEQQHNASSVTITIFLILALLTALGVGVYYKRRRNQAPTNADMSSAEIFPLSAISQGDSASIERPIMSNTQQIEQYLLSALANNVLMEQLFDKYPRGQTQYWDYGVKPENKKKNRYGNLAAYDSSRVKLELLPGDENSDYINANYIDGFERPKAYIATQGPRVNTLDDFWRMVWQEKVPLIVMVTNLLEGGKNKCEKYWPDNNQEVTHGRITVRTVDKEVNADYVSRVLSVSCNNSNRLVQHLHYTVWPDHGVPLYPQSMAVFVEKIAEKNYAHPILVHCSAGVGRTGTVILIDACLRMIRTHGRLDVENIFATMRSQRANLVDNLKQFEFAHLVLLECVANPNFEISCANFTVEYNKLTSKNNEKLKESYEKLSEICERDFQRTETPAKNETDKCRYPNVISTSNSIVRLFPYQNVVTMSFVNAVTVDGYKKPKQFIATQVPMKNTVADFWRMVDQFNVSEIVVLNEPHITEAQFLPTNQSRLIFGEIEVFLDDVQEYHSVKTTDVTLKKKAKSKKMSVKCASFGWMPGDLSPPNLGPLIDLWDNLKIAGEKECIAIVCHDGVTASGLFLGMGFVIEKIKLEQKVDVGLAVRTLKKSRPAFVSSEIQFGLLYEAAKHYLCSFDTYGNFK